MLSKPIVLLQKNGREAICGGGCGEVRRLLGATVFHLDGSVDKAILFDACLDCMATKPDLQDIFIREFHLSKDVVFALPIDDKDDVTCCSGSQLPRQLLPMGYLYPCHECERKYFQPF